MGVSFIPLLPRKYPHLEQHELENLINIRIIGIDERRPPVIVKEPYIDLYFKLSEAAPPEWCDDFDKLVGKIEPPIRLDKTKGLIIQTYVRELNQIVPLVDLLKKNVATCNKIYSERIHRERLAAAEKSSALQREGGMQAKLNAIIASLKFDD